MKKIISLLLVFLMTAAVFSFPSISAAESLPGDVNGDGKINNKDVVLLFRFVSGDTAGAVVENCDFNGDGVHNNKDVVALFRAVSEGTVPTPGETFEEGWDQTISTANGLANGVQGRFTDAGRHKFYISNTNMSMLYDLTTNGEKGVSAVYNADGAPYFTGVSDVRVINAEGSVFSAAESMNSGRMNSHRLGYYYYDFRFCDQIFVSESSKEQMTEGEDYYDIIQRSGTWNTHDTSRVTKLNGEISYTVTNTYDPYVYTPVSFSAEKFDAIQITIKTEAAQSGNFYIVAGSQRTYNAEQNIGFRFNSGEWTTFVVPLASIPDYTGTVTGFRIDVGEAEGELVQVKELKAIKRGDSSVPLSLERVFHTYSDKLHEVVRIVASGEYTGGGRFESKTVIPKSTVNKLILKNGNGESTRLSGFDFSSTEFVGFDIKGAGVFGIIMPALSGNGTLKVELDGDDYVITHSKDISGTLVVRGGVSFGHRIYTSEDHDFEGLRNEAYIERNPLKSVSITKKEDNARFAGYNALTGCYRFTVNASDFNRAYYKEPDKHYRINTQIKGDGVTDRTIYIQTAETGGMLECAALLDENERLLPIPIEVGKNFCGEKEEPLYDPSDTAYGEAYVPITVGKNETKRYSMLHLYQNWGNYPLKQLSFIAFHICYYHLSVGVTETNCIAPYFVYGKDGWTLPDFRANSAPLWSGQPQHTSAGRLYFLQYKDSSGKSYKSESQSADVSSAGPVYADINMEYLSDDGKIRATYRHAEMPQTDENRTYYDIKLEVLEDVSIANFRNDFSFFTFDGRAVAYSKVGYLNSGGSMITENVKSGTRVIKLGKEYPYYDYYSGNVSDSVNFALIVTDSDITVGGKKYDGNFVFRDSYNGSLNTGSLSLDLGAVTLKKGDVLQLRIILLPWGYSTSTNDSNVRAVREDSCISPYKLEVVTGSAYEDAFIPSVRAKNGTAKFRLSGGKNNAVVRVYGFSGYTAPQITVKADGAATDFKVSGSHGYDGYQVYLDGDGTYSFSFVINVDDADVYEITVKQ